MVPKTKVRAVQVTGPLGAYADEVKAALEKRGYTPLTVAGKLRLMNRLSRWLKEREIPPGELNDEHLAVFVELLNSKKRTAKRHTSGVLESLIEPLRDLSLVPAEPNVVLKTATATEMLVSSFWHYLLTERTLASSTAQAYVLRVQRFLDRDVPGRTVAQLHASDITTAVLAESQVVSTGAVQFFACALRSFLRFCFLEGVMPNDLSTAVLPASRRHQTLLPKGIDRSDMQAMVDACDLDAVNGVRDVAILLMLVRLGLRAGEVAGLKLDDIDWRSGTLTIRGKGNRVDQLPLPSEVGRAIATYVQQSRPPSTYREVFLSVIAPVVPLGRGGIGFVVRRSCRRAGVAPVGPHVLRHSVACEMVNAQVPFVMISQTLRHKSLSSTAIYARFDTEALRDLALAWPGGDQ